MNGNYKIVITKSAQKDKEKIKSFPSLKNNVDNLLEILRNDPFQSPPPFERLRGELSVYYSRRINKQHRLVYMIDTDLKVVKIVAMWTYYQRI